MRAAALAGLALSVCSAAWAAADFLYTDAEADCAAQLIFTNECSAKEENLVFWSPDEAFPSLGVGHFIWYPEGASGPYRESFPGFLDFARETGLAVPPWIAGLPGGHAPWKSREEFLENLDSAPTKHLRAFLNETRRAQAHYILRRFQKIFPTILDDLSESQRQPVRDKYNLLMKSPKGAFAMIDYVNFKGEGLRTDARYEGIGWGLAQVLLEMEVPDDPEKALDAFILAAERVLERRIEHAPQPDIEKKWLPGWKNRLQGYRHINCA